jgi:FKBP-type peptidyl-prolyl cis-trans isomerase 2
VNAEDGTFFCTSKNREPLKLTIGSGEAISGLEECIEGMEIGDRKTFSVPPEEAFGEKRQELMVELKRNHLPESITPSVGEKLIMQKDGKIIDAFVAHITEDALMIDANHPLAGKTLIFDVELVEII